MTFHSPVKHTHTCTTPVDQPFAYSTHTHTHTQLLELLIKTCNLVLKYQTECVHSFESFLESNLCSFQEAGFPILLDQDSSGADNSADLFLGAGLSTPPTL